MVSSVEFARLEETRHVQTTAYPASSSELRVLDRLQQDIPLVEFPYRAIGAELRLGEDTVIAHVRALKERRLLRQIGAIFDAPRLGYRSSLVAARYAPEAIDQAAAIISACPGVSHNYRRDHAFNLWYTIAVPPEASLEEVVDRLHRESGAHATRLLPTLRRFKLAVRLDLQGQRSAHTREDAALSQTVSQPVPPLRGHELRAVRALQDDLPVCSRPFAEAATREGFASTGALLETAADLRARGIMRRFSGVVRHREAGFGANGMVAWAAEDDACTGFGPLMASFTSVSHCYQRPTYEDWPYSLFTMIHGRSRQEVEECIDAIRDATGLTDCCALYSTVEYKKRRVRYFTDEWDAWEQQMTAEAANR